MKTKTLILYEIHIKDFSFCKEHLFINSIGQCYCLDINRDQIYSKMGVHSSYITLSIAGEPLSTSYKYHLEKL